MIFLFLIFLQVPVYAYGAPTAPVILKRFENLLPKELSKKWRNSRSQMKISFAEKDISEGCARVQRLRAKHKLDNTHKLRLVLNPRCLAEVPDREFEKIDLQNPILKDLYRAAVKLWYRTSRLAKQQAPLIYAKNFYFTPLTLGVNIETSFENAMVNYWVETTLAYMTNPQLIYLHPDVYAILRETFFHQEKFFKEELGNVKITPTSSELYPSLAKLKIIVSPSEAWFWRYYLVKNAEDSILVQSYLLGDDLFAKSFLALLIEALRRKVKVRIMLDGRGSIGIARANAMEALAFFGAEVVTYNPVFLGMLNITKFITEGPIDGIVASNHDKILLVDDRHFITGGRNMAERYFLEKSEQKEGDYVFRDTDIYAEFEKPFIAAQSAFYTEFYSPYAYKLKRGWFGDPKHTERALFENLHALEERMAGDELSEETKRKFPELTRYTKIAGYKNFVPGSLVGPLKVRGLDKTSALMGKDYLSEELYRQIKRCERSIVIQNPYVVLTSKMEKALVEITTRPVNPCKIILNTASAVSSNHPIVDFHLLNHWKKILEKLPNAEIHGAVAEEHLHAKIFIFDSKTVLVGGYNLDHLSEKHNSEFGLLIEDPEFALASEDIVIQYIAAKSMKYDPNGKSPFDIPGVETKTLRVRFLRFLAEFLARGSWL